MVKPITYWVQNDAINQLVYQYGAKLERLSLGTRRELIAYLAAADEWDWSNDVVHPLESIYPLVEYLTRQEKDLLMEAIAHSLVPSPSNPVYNPQKEGTPTH
ncbi:MAG: hypothetical protein KME45_32775 [Stenomitos rutilans HA7619-LM2]|jgi:hypothetical protein|nr:hypothetical protein [Stenomitos rutilans HA7619-LM2]